MPSEPIVASIPFPLPLDRGAAESLQHQLGRALRRAIHAGALPGGWRLPSTRSLSADLGLSRNTVLYAYEQLEAEGYLTSRRGAGTYVASLQGTVPGASMGAPPPRAPRLAGRCARTAALELESELPAAAGPFMVGLPDLAAFPWKAWGRLSAARLRTVDAALIDHGDPRGSTDLREAIAAYVRTSRGVRCTPERVLVTGGSQHALALAARVLLDPGDTVWMEEPGYRGARAAFLGAGARVVGVPVDEEGMDPAAVPEGAGSPRCVFVTPSNQFPTGATMSLERRLAWLDLTREHDAWIVEDDYDSEFRYTGAPVPALQGLDGEGRVLYVGTFSKTLSPSLRAGYLVLPEVLVQPFVAMRAVSDPYPCGLSQAVLADWIVGGHYARHLARMRRHYRRRRRFLVERLELEFSDVLRARPASGGLHLVADLPSGTDDVLLSAALRAAGVKASPISAFHLAAPASPALLLGYAGFDETCTLNALARMRAALDRGEARA